MTNNSAGKKYTLENRDIGAFANVPLSQLRTLLNIPGAEERGTAFSSFFGSIKDAQATINDIEHFKAIINWSPEGQGVAPLEMAKRLSLAGKIIVSGKANYIVLTDPEIDVVKAILNNEQFRLIPNTAFYGFLISLQELIGPIYTEPKEEAK